MRLYIDASVFLHLLFEEKHADEAETILSSVENGENEGYITPLVVEEVAFKLLLGKASELGVGSFYKFKEMYAKDANFRRKCYEPVARFMEYLESLIGLRWVDLDRDILLEALTISASYGLLPADAIHAATALKLNVPLASFDRDFRGIPGLRVIP